MKLLVNAGIGVYLIFICVLALFACRSDQTPPVKSEKHIGSVKFYIDNSASMGGYFQKDADFKTLVSGLTIKIDKNIKPIDIWFTADTPATKYNGSAQQFGEDIAKTQIATGKSSQLHKIIADISTKNDSNDVSLLVSDCILSFSSDEVKKNPEINRTEAPNTLKNNVFGTFSDLRKKGFSASVYAFKSKFYTVPKQNIFYYDYQNAHKELNGEQRPFYLWVIADKELLAMFNAKLADMPGFSPEKSLHFGLPENQVTEITVIPQLLHHVNWTWDEGERTIEDVNFRKKEPLEFCVLLNLKALPPYVQEVKYLQDSLKVEAEGCSSVKFEVTDKSPKEDKSGLSKSQIESLNNTTHYLIVKADCQTATQMHITLPIHYDTWYEKWSTDDDRDIKTTENKTFAFKYLIDGVKDAYETKGRNYIDFTVTLKN